MSPTELIKRLTDELNAATDHREQLKSKLTETTQLLNASLPKLRDKLYAPLWMIPSTQDGPRPNTLWLITSLAMIVSGVWMML